MISRRRFVIGGAVTGAALALPVTQGSAAAARTRTTTTGPFTVRMPVPPVLRPTSSTSTTDTYVMEVKEGVEQLLPGKTTTVFGYTGTFVGPTIKARKDRKVIVRQTNGFTGHRHIATHLHGGHLPPEHDGHPMDVLHPGDTREYHYNNRQSAATLWYHDHAHHEESENVFRGLAGFYLLCDPAEDYLRLPSGEFDVPIMLRDARFADDGSLVYVMDDFANRKTILVNGRNQPYFPVKARKYRFRFLNASNLRPFELRLQDGSQMIQIGGDQGLLPKPAPMTGFTTWPGERHEIVIDFSRYPVGTKVVLENVLGETDGERLIMRFDVVATASDSSLVPATLAPAPSLPPATNTRDVVLGPVDPVTNSMLIDGKTFDHNRIDNTIKLGTTEIWRIRNAESQFPIPHNLHIHLVKFKVLDRNGAPPPAGETGWKDTVTVLPGETVRVQATFGGYTGRYVYHCHLIDHASMGMMAQMEIVP
ncbi:MAG TPA: multicopper oxidase family protein [Thermomonospora sp.]|nr:multicopper oxidase family protein [Thermomonospora sp.]